MLFESKEMRCTVDILKILHANKSKYSYMFKKTKVSHTTLQRTLHELIEKKFITKHDIGHMKVDYVITEKGKRLLELLFKLKEILAS